MDYGSHRTRHLSTGRCRCVRDYRFGESSIESFKPNENGHVTWLQPCTRRDFELLHEHSDAPKPLSGIRHLSSIDDVSYTRDLKTSTYSQYSPPTLVPLSPASRFLSCTFSKLGSLGITSHLCYPRPECDSPSVGKKACKPALQHRDHVPTTSIRLQSISKLAMPSPTPFTQMAQMRPIVILPLAKIGASTFMLCHFLNRYTTLLIYDSLSTSGQQCVSHDWQL
jgi:hypothetical protein